MSGAGITEGVVKQATLDWFRSLGYAPAVPVERDVLAHRQRRGQHPRLRHQASATGRDAHDASTLTEKQAGALLTNCSQTRRHAVASDEFAWHTAPALTCKNVPRRHERRPGFPAS